MLFKHKRPTTWHSRAKSQNGHQLLTLISDIIHDSIIEREREIMLNELEELNYRSVYSLYIFNIEQSNTPVY